MRKNIVLTALIVAVWASSIGPQERFGVEKWLAEAGALLAATDSYTAIFHKQELLEGNLSREETIFFKFKKPFKIYMKWIDKPHRGRESLYVEGENKNRIKAREGGIWGLFTVNLDPLGKRVMRENRHPITESGLENLVKLIENQVRKGMEAGELALRELGEEQVYGRRTLKVEGIFPKDDTRGYYCYRTVMNLDAELKVPIKVKVYDWDDLLVENYGYEDLNLGAGLTDADFDPKNPEYRF